MEAFSFPISQYPIVTPTIHPPLFSAIFAAKPFPSAASTAFPTTPSTSMFFCLRPPPDSINSANSPALSGNLRRPNKYLQSSTPSSQQNPRIPSNPLKIPLNSAHVTSAPNNSHSLTNKLWLTSKLSSRPPPQSPVDQEEETGSMENNENGNSDESSFDNSPPITQFRQEGKIFVGNLPNWIKKNEVSGFFRQFGPIKNVILIKGHSDTERNAGFGFVIYGGLTADKSAVKAAEFDGIEFHGRNLTVKLDDGKRLKEKSQERARWGEGDDGVEYRSKWHEERESSRKEFRTILETEPDNWQVVVNWAFYVFMSYVGLLLVEETIVALY